MIRLQIRNLRYHDIGPVDLSIKASECVSLSGPSGAGKTLMLRAVADLEPHEGNVYLDNVNAKEMSPSEWRKKVGMLSAESQWWHDTVEEHFKEVDGQSLEMLGLDKGVMGWRVSRLSSGERQRLALLRLLCNRPKALLLDEPTANLDPESSRGVEKLLESYRLQQEASLLWISHDAEQIGRVAARQFVLRDGRLLEQKVP